MDVRRMQPEDLDSAGALLAQLGYDVAPEELRRRFLRAAALPHHALLVASDAGRIVGFVHVAGTDFLYAPPFADVGALVVDDARRRGGVGSTLVRAAEGWARAAGYEEIRIRSRLSREGAHRFYVRLGFAKEKAQFTFVKGL